jgi:hypothetical protein
LSKKSKRGKRAKEPLHYDPPFEHEEEELPPKESTPKYRVKMAYLLDQEEVNRLIEASSAPLPEIAQPEPTIHFNSYTEEEVQSLLEGDFKPRKTKKKKSS